MAGVQARRGGLTRRAPQEGRGEEAAPRRSEGAARLLRAQRGAEGFAERRGAEERAPPGAAAAGASPPPARGYARPQGGEASAGPRPHFCCAPEMGKGACHAEDRPGARLAAKAGLGAGMGLRQRSLKRLQSVKEDLSALRALWLAPRRLRDSKSHEERLAHYYDKQANTYDHLPRFHGRDRLMAALAQRLANQTDLVWCDLGSGTAEAIAQMAQYMDLGRFKAIYVVDLCEPLAQAAEAKIAENGWTNVHVVREDASTFRPPGGTADLITFAYSLSMMPEFHSVIDGTISYLAPGGLIGGADYFVSSKYDTSLRQTSSIARFFWRSIFDLDGVDIGPERRAYLEHRLTTVHEYNGLGRIPYVPLVRVPFYVWIGSNSTDPEQLRVLAAPGPIVRSPGEKAAKPPMFSLFPSSFLYSVSWEDPEPDRPVLDVQPGDRLITLCAGGCNCFEYLHQGAAQVTAVDLNPAQTHLLELKAVCVARLPYEDVWKLFGEGVHEDAEALFQREIFPYLSQDAVEFWSERMFYFKHGLYYFGGMGMMIMCMKYTAMLLGMQRNIAAFLEAPTLEDQVKAWNSFWLVYAWKHMPRILWGFLQWVVTSIFLSKPMMWFGAGVPPAQLKLITDEVPICEYVLNLLDGVATTNHLRDSNYFYRVCLTGKFTKSCCPFWLKKENFDELKRTNAVTRLHIKTGTYQSELEKCEYTRAVIMDHMDWLGEAYGDQLSAALARQIAPGGKIIWRSATRDPPYRKQIEAAGFECKQEAAHAQGTPYIDRINMYASFWSGTRIGKAEGN